MFKFTFIRNYAKNVLLLTIYIFQVCSASTHTRDAAMVYITVKRRIIK